MKKLFSLLNKGYILVFGICFSFTENVLARAGGGGGGGDGGDGGDGGGGGYDGSSYDGSSYDGGSYNGSSYHGDLWLVWLLIPVGFLVAPFVIAVIWDLLYPEKEKKFANRPDTNRQFPEGLQKEKILLAFTSIQTAWQNKDLKEVRKWISDGVYQRFNAQFAMMNKLSQVNNLSNISVDKIRCDQTDIDGNYQIADVAIRFKMDDEFISDKYPSFNKYYTGETAVEYWTFIKRQDAQTDKNLYTNKNCPNCGALVEINLGEISRCGGCGTLTNNGSYDWVLSEITQEVDYNSKINFAQKKELQQLTKNDKFFAVQRIEDVASNIFMQVMEVMCGASEIKLSRFADELTVNSIIKSKKEFGNFIFNRLYLNSVDLVSFCSADEKINLSFFLKVSYQRVREGEQIKLLDSDVVTTNCTMILSKNENALHSCEKETVYSYECSNCGAPYSDTTNAVCGYCNASVIDFKRNWILTFFKMAN